MGSFQQRHRFLLVLLLWGKGLVLVSLYPEVVADPFGLTCCLEHIGGVFLEDMDELLNVGGMLGWVMTDA